MKSKIAIPILALLALLLVCISAHEFDMPERQHFGFDGIHEETGNYFKTSVSVELLEQKELKDYAKD
jgi:hypothetical protein